MPTTIKRTIEVTDQQISDLLITALDPGYGGALYWADITDRVAPTEYVFQVDHDEPEDKRTIYPRADYPMNPGGSITIKSSEDDEINGKTEWILNREVIDRGLQLMAEMQPRHFEDAISETKMDAETADVFLQLCVFGEVVYG